LPEGHALDVHAPHEPIHSFKDFLLHLLTITVGLLIAVGIEGCVELHREHTLVRDARETMRAEIDYNAQEMVKQVGTLDKERDAIDVDIKNLTRILEDPKDKEAQKGSISADFSTQSLRQTAWKTAQTTGALTYMPHEEAQKYAEVYEMQENFLTQQDKILEDEAQFLGVVAKSDFGKGDTTREQAASALERFGIWKGHLSYLYLMARVSLATDKAFLEGKDAPREMHEDFK
jgi:hypothetical protein